MDFLEGLKVKLAVALGCPPGVSMGLSFPPRPELGDLSVACFDLAKDKQRPAPEVARELEASLKADLNLKKYLADVQAAGSYLNFFISPEYLAAALIKEVRRAGAKYGQNDSGQGKKVLVEYSNVNTHKEYHVGHLRNITYGEAATRLLAANGYQAIPVSYVNDFGIHVAKTIWNWRRDKAYQTRPENKGYLLGQCYVAASKELAGHPEYQSEVAAIMKSIESRRGAAYALWQETRQWSIKYFQTIYQELGAKFDYIFYESEVVDDGLKLVQELRQKGILVKSEGAIIANLEKYDLGVLPIIRTDGTALYPVGDLSLAAEKFRKYALDLSIYVIDVRQSLYFKQLFKILELSGYRPAVLHLSYDFVTLPGGMMSSRTGNVVTYEELKGKLLEKLIAETKERHADWTAKRVRQAALDLTAATIKFELLKVGHEKIITFNIDEAARFDGFTACYLEYSYARLKSVVRRERPWSLITPLKSAALQEAKEKQLLMKIARYPEAVKSAAHHYDPSVLAKYLFELSQLSNDYYHSVNILKAPAAVKRARLVLVKAVAQTLKNGLNLLGIKALEEM